MEKTPLDLAIILGSVRQGRFGPAVTRWFVSEAQRHGAFRTEVIDLAETPLPLVLPPEPPAIAAVHIRPPEMANLTRQLDKAHAFVIVTPEYNRSFPASIKSAIDWHYTQWQAKPVGFVSYGATGGGLRAVEQLRLVFAEMHAVTVRHSVAFARYWEVWSEDGGPAEPEESNAGAKTMLDQLAWWAGAIEGAKERSPYPVR